MAIAFLSLLFLAFISLGLPDTGFGVAWPFIRIEFDLPLGAAGIISIVSVACGIFSALFSGKIINKLGEARVTAISCLLTGVGMVGYWLSPNFAWMIVSTIPAGFGAGCVDSALNSYVAKHYSNRIMSWLHGFWAVGATISPIVITYAITTLNNWRSGYLVIAIFQLLLTILLFASTRLWRKQEQLNNSHMTVKKINIYAEQNSKKKSAIVFSMLIFFLYCGIETTIGLWLNTLLIEGRNIDVSTSGLAVAVYFGGIMVGRFISGAIKVDTRKLITVGIVVSMVGGGLLFINNIVTTFIAVALIGLGFAPIYPSLMHETAARFNDKTAVKMIGFQTAGAYTSMFTVAPLVGILCDKVSVESVVVTFAIFTALLFVCNLLLNKVTPKKMVDEGVEQAI